MYNLTWAVVLLPLAGILAAWLVESPRRSAQLVAAATGVAFVVAMVLLLYRLAHVHDNPFQSLITFWTFDPGQQLPGGFVSDFHLQVGVLLDGMSAVLLPAVALVSLLVQLHSTGFLRGGGGQTRYAATVGLMTFAAFALVTSPNLFELYVMWELLGVGAFLLVGHWWDRPRASAAARKLLVVTRIGDLALLLGIVVTFSKFAGHVAQLPLPSGQEVNDPFNFYTLSREWQTAHLGHVSGVGGRTLAIIALLFLVGALGKAAQLPLHTWLPDSVEAPMPASALIQAGTFTVAAGVLLARTYGVFLVAPHMLSVVALVGAVSAVIGALAALAHTDIRRVLAYSTMSSLGLALVGFGVGAFAAGLFQVFAHMWVKALLLLAAANVVQAYRTHDLTEMGGVWRRMRGTALALAVGCAAMAGVVLLTGFWSEGSVLAGVLRNRFATGGHVGRGVQVLLVIAVLATVVLTALYAVRLLLLVVAGEPVRRRRFQPERVRDPERSQLLPLAVLAPVAALVGFAAVPGVRVTFARLVSAAGIPQSPPFDVTAFVLTAVLALAGVAVAWAVWGRRLPAPTRVRERLAPAAAVAAGGFGVDAAWSWAVSRLLVRPAPVLGRFDEEVGGALAEALSDDVAATAERARTWQRGRLPVYALSAVAGLVLLVGGITLAATGHLPGVGATR